MRIAAIIPAHMASVRFPGKILHPFYGLPMIEHVRRRALLSSSLDVVIVATCDEAIAAVIRGFGGKVIMTANTHKNGTTRVAEAIKNVDCTHVILLQGDEPLLLPRHVDALADAIRVNPNGDAWNATGPIENQEELDRHSFVKCAIGRNSRILFCFRRSPCYTSLEKQKGFVRKILGVIAYKKKFLLDLTKLPPSEIEQAEFIEQMRIIENGYELSSIPLSPSLPSVNEPSEAGIVLDYIKSDSEQKQLLGKILTV
jgi:3-deoxy-manno-octulosonate cytidylyltransferase (CMP-KDO synthetase)